MSLVKIYFLKILKIHSALVSAKTSIVISEALYQDNFMDPYLTNLSP